jgi:hypothetical protein
MSQLSQDLKEHARALSLLAVLQAGYGAFSCRGSVR